MHASQRPACLGVQDHQPLLRRRRRGRGRRCRPHRRGSGNVVRTARRGCAASTSACRASAVGGVASVPGSEDHTAATCLAMCMPTPVISARPGVWREPVECTGDGVRHVAAGRTARIRQPAGDGQAARVVDGESQGVAAQPERRGEAGVQVERVDLVEPDAGRCERMPARPRTSPPIGTCRRARRCSPGPPRRPSHSGRAAGPRSPQAHRPSPWWPAAAPRTCRRPSPRPRAWCRASRRSGCPGWESPPSAASSATGRQACGLPAATTLMAAIIAAASAASSASDAPRRARRAVSHSGNVSQACSTSWAISDGVRRLPGERRGLAMAPRQPLHRSSWPPARWRAPRRCRSAPGPARRVASPPRSG